MNKTRFNTDTRQTLASMMFENTGTHFLDSGGAYGRAWQQTRSTVPVVLLKSVYDKLTDDTYAITVNGVTFDKFQEFSDYILNLEYREALDLLTELLNNDNDLDTLADILDAKPYMYMWDTGIYKGQLTVNVSVNTYQYLCETLERDSYNVEYMELLRELYELVTNEYCHWTGDVETMLKWAKSNGLVYFFSEQWGENTYNYENSFDEVLQFSCYQLIPSEFSLKTAQNKLFKQLTEVANNHYNDTLKDDLEHSKQDVKTLLTKLEKLSRGLSDFYIMALQIHRGADVRGGYTEVKFFEVYDLYIVAPSTYIFAGKYSWYSDDNYNYYGDNIDDLDDIPAYDLEDLDHMPEHDTFILLYGDIPVLSVNGDLYQINTDNKTELTQTQKNEINQLLDETKKESFIAMNWDTEELIDIIDNHSENLYNKALEIAKNNPPSLAELEFKKLYNSDIKHLSHYKISVNEVNWSQIVEYFTS